MGAIIACRCCISHKNNFNIRNVTFATDERVLLPGDEAAPAWFSDDFPVTHDHFAPDHG